MHELSIALSIIEMADEQARQRSASRVSAVHLKLGPLSGVVTEALQSAYELACEGSMLEGSRLVIEEMPIVTYCATCRANRPVASIQRMCCDVCDTPATQLVSGQELEVTAMEIHP